MFVYYKTVPTTEAVDYEEPRTADNAMHLHGYKFCRAFDFGSDQPRTEPNKCLNRICTMYHGVLAASRIESAAAYLLARFLESCYNLPRNFCSELGLHPDLVAKCHPLDRTWRVRNYDTSVRAIISA